MLAYRLVRGKSITGRSYCLHCKHTISWFDLIPVFSWVLLKGQCRYCRASISFLYPLIELITAISLTIIVLSYTIAQAWVLGIFASCLIVTLRSDLESLRISRFVTIFAIPIVWIIGYFSLLPVSLSASIVGALTGYFFLWLIRTLYYVIKGKIGMGLGDLELMAFIGSVLGPELALLIFYIACLTATIISLYTIFRKGSSAIATHKLPLGAYIAGVALLAIMLNPLGLIYSENPIFSIFTKLFFYARSS